MELAIWLLSGVVALLLTLLLILILAFRVIAKHLTQTIQTERERNQVTLTNLHHQNLETQKPLISLLSKTASLLVTKDPIAFQQVQLMDSASTPETSQNVDRSDSGELQQWIEDNDDKLTAVEKEYYRELDPTLL